LEAELPVVNGSANQFMALTGTGRTRPIARIDRLPP
jgi:hypothetical protein